MTASLKMQTQSSARGTQRQGPGSTGKVGWACSSARWGCPPQGQKSHLQSSLCCRESQVKVSFVFAGGTAEVWAQQIKQRPSLALWPLDMAWQGCGDWADHGHPPSLCSMDGTRSSSCHAAGVQMGGRGKWQGNFVMRIAMNAPADW